MAGHNGPRVAALVGPYLSGKTTLLEALLHASGTTNRRGTTKEGNTVGDHSPEARARQMSTEINVAAAKFLDDPWTILDCPGSVELSFEAQCALLAADVAVVVCEPVIDKALTLAPLLKFLDDRDIPHMLFINKLDTAEARVSEVLAALQAVSARRWCCARCRSPARKAPPTAMSIWSASAPTNTSPARRPTSSRFPTACCPTSRRGAAAWSKSSPISTTSCWSNCSRTCSPRRKTSTSI